MNAERANEILQSKMKCDVFYEKKPVWIQDVRDNIAKIGFLDGSKEKNVYLEDLYERSLYQ
ncbi:MAG: H-type small acid-soluble spore protein [Clostridia bacterium]